MDLTQACQKKLQAEPLSDHELMLFLDACKQTTEILTLAGRPYWIFRTEFLKYTMEHAGYAYNRKLISNQNDYYPKLDRYKSQESFSMLDHYNADPSMRLTMMATLQFLRDMGEQYDLCHNALAKELNLA